MSILSFFFIFFLSFIFLRKRKNGFRRKIVLTSIAFLVYIPYRFSEPQNKLKFCFTWQFFTYDTIKTTNEFNTSHFQSDLRNFAISKFRFKTVSHFMLNYFYFRVILV